MDWRAVKKDLLHRYEVDADGKVIIDVAASKAEDLYNDFDRSAPYVRRDLDQNLVDYLIDCAKELGQNRFRIRFTLDQAPDESRLSRIKRSVNTFFLYLAEVEGEKIRRMRHRSLVLLGIGIAILSISVWANQSLGSTPSVVGSVFAQGLTIAAWVSLWEAVATFLLEWFPHRAQTRLYRRLAEAQLVLGSPSVTKPRSNLPQPGAGDDSGQAPSLPAASPDG